MNNSAATKKKRAKYLDNRELALGIQARGLKKVQKEAKGRIDAVRASKIVALLREMGYEDKSIDEDLMDLSSSKKRGHTGGPVTPPVEGEERLYAVGVNGRIGVPVNIMGKNPGDKVKVRYSKRGIKVLP